MSNTDPFGCLDSGTFSLASSLCGCSAKTDCSHSAGGSCGCGKCRAPERDGTPRPSPQAPSSTGGMDWGQQGFKIRQDETFMVPAPSKFAGWKTGYGPKFSCGGECDGSSSPRRPLPLGIGAPAPYERVAASQLLNELLEATAVELVVAFVASMDSRRILSGPANPLFVDSPWDVQTWADGGVGVRCSYDVGLAQGEPIERICGPDVTDLVVASLEKIMSERAAGSPVSAGWMARPESDIDFKGTDETHPRVRFGDCPRNCPYGITLCDACVSDQIPGNIGLGAGSGRIAAAAIGAFEGGESGEDLSAYALGDFLYESLYPAAGARPSSSDIRKLLCQLVAETLLPKDVCEKKYKEAPGFLQYACGECPMPPMPPKPAPRPGGAPPRTPSDPGPGVPPPGSAQEQVLVDYWSVHGWAW